jgi:plastocyanin
LTKIFVVLAIGLTVACTRPDMADSLPTAPSGSLTVTITSAGVNPKTLVVTPGSQVMFVNNDASDHWMSSDPHPDHLDCPALNQVGVLSPGQSRQTGNLNTIRTCGFHDHAAPSNTSLQGTLLIR